MMNLPEEFVLLAYADDGTPETDGTHLDNGLGGALLLELALAERIEITDQKLLVRDDTPVGDSLADAALFRIGAEPKHRKAQYWVQKLAKDTRSQVLDTLVSQGVLKREKDRVLLVFPRTIYPPAHGVEPTQETAARDRLRAAVEGSGAVDPRTGALCALLAATGLDRKVFADLDRRRVKARLKEIGEGAWAADAVKKAIDDVQVAIMAGVIASTAATSAATTSAGN